MIKSVNKIYPFYLLMDLIFVGVSFLLSYFIRYKYNNIFQDSLPYFKEYALIFVLWTAFMVAYFKKRNLYSTDRSLTVPKEISKTITAVLFVSVLMTAVIFFTKQDFFSRKFFFINIVFFCFFLSSWRIIKRIILRKLISEGFHNINILIVGTGHIGKITLEEIRKNPWWGFKIIGFLDESLQEDIMGIPILGKLKDFSLITKKNFIDEVIITMPLEDINILELIKQAKCLNVGIRVIPEDFEEAIQILDVGHLGILPVLTYKERKNHPSNLFLKRFFDLVISLFLIILLLPLFIIIAILIKMGSSGPIFFIQKRIGLKGKTFNLCKFRSMAKDADKLKSTLLDKNEVKDGIIFKIKKDPRITNLGMFLRRWSIDELPQLFNVIKGEMSLVGPRPPTPEEVKQYNHMHMDRLSIRPGITGISQIKARNTFAFRKWVRWDLWYINNWSFLLDLQILIWTIPAIIKGEGAY